LWGTTPIGAAYVAPGSSIRIAEDGSVTDERHDAALEIRTHASGATVARPPGATRGPADTRWLPAGASEEIAIAAPGSAAPSGEPADCRGGAWEPTPLVLWIAVTTEDPRRRTRPAIAARFWAILASVAAVHAVVLAVASGAIPRRWALNAPFASAGA